MPTKQLQRKVKCPSCGEKSVWSPENPYRPFCSQRCRNHDTANWVNESYVVSTPMTLQDESAPSEPES